MVVALQELQGLFLFLPAFRWVSCGASACRKIRDADDTARGLCSEWKAIQMRLIPRGCYCYPGRFKYTEGRLKWMAAIYFVTISIHCLLFSLYMYIKHIHACARKRTYMNNMSRRSKRTVLAGKDTRGSRTWWYLWQNMTFLCTTTTTSEVYVLTPASVLGVTLWIRAQSFLRGNRLPVPKKASVQHLNDNYQLPWHLWSWKFWEQNIIRF